MDERPTRPDGPSQGVPTRSHAAQRTASVEVGIEDMPPPEIPGYRDFELIGGGGFGRVYRALQIGLDRSVAVKVLHNWLSDDPEFRTRFLREGQVLARLNHENIVRVIETGGDDRQMWMVMEYIEGQTLFERLKGEDLGTEASVAILTDVCRALQLAHANGVVHRDIKPSNILIDHRGRARVVDFGLAKLGRETQLTLTGKAMGTPGYCAPEQITGQTMDERTDIFTLGLLGYQLLTGKIPTPGAEPPSALNPAVPAAVDEVVMAAMQTNPLDRPATVTAFLDAFGEGQRRRGRRWGSRLAWLLLVPLLIVTAAAFLLLRPGSGIPQPVASFPLEPGLESVDEAGPGVSLVANRFGREQAAVAFSGTNSFLKSTLPTADSLSISWWIKIANTNDTGTVVGMNPAYNIFFQEGTVIVRTKAGGKHPGALFSTSIQTTKPLPAKRWTHVLWTRDADNGRQALYVDGELDQEAFLVTGHIPDYSWTHLLGANIGSAGNMGCSRLFLDDVYFFDRALGPDEVTALFERPDNTTGP